MWPFTKKLIKAKAYIRDDIDETIVEIYRGYDFYLLYAVCSQSCVYGVKDKNKWVPPHRINKIVCEVEDYDATFDEYEKELVNRTEKGETE